ncbi:MAG TPA: penicillin-binding transpeptidase domain-containing protein [Opitutaceae bacterium]|nr:penicillin-binding transpeptidase domain-containing protein [Opitutaceae bacterium]
MDTTKNLSDRSGGLVESFKGYDPRVIFFYFIIAGLMLVLMGGLAYQQLINTGAHNERERQQNQRRVLVPGPRGNIYDREGRLLVGNRPRFAVVLYLDELRGEINREERKIRKAYRATGDKDLPTDSQMLRIARVTVAQRYLDQISRLLGRPAKIDSASLDKHFRGRLLLPYTLLEDLSPEDYAHLLEGLPVVSPVQVYTSSTRYYPYGSAAAHTLGFVGQNEDIDAEDFPGEKLMTFKLKGTIGRDGLEKRFDSTLQGEAGGRIFRVDPAGYRVDSPDLPQRLPVQGKHLTTSLDIDLQRVAETALGDQVGTAVAIDVKTGEILTLASKPDYDLTNFSPRLSAKAAADIEERKAWTNLAIGGTFPPGSTFKILTTIAGLRRGVLDPEKPITDCRGTIRIGNRPFVCSNGNGQHGEVLLKDAIAHSCDVYYYAAGELITADGIAEEARRFHMHERTGIELPNETGRMVIPDPAYKERVIHEKWFPGDTANMSIGQGYVLVTPLEMACFVASVARNEVYTKPTLVHQPNAAPQHSESIGLTPAQRAVLLAGMEGCTTYGSAKPLSTVAAYRIPGVRIAGKTGTAQKEVKRDGKTGTINYGWFICFAPAENPEVAVAVVVEGDTIGEAYAGGTYAAPVASAILKKYFEKKNRPVTPLIKGLNPL